VSVLVLLGKEAAMVLGVELPLVVLLVVVKLRVGARLG
jgi:hypothetical protein